MRRVAPVAVLLLAGCGGRTLHIDSDTAWTGTIDGLGTVSGRGSQIFALSASPAAAKVCWTIQKTSDAGTLRVFVDTDTFFGLGTEVEGEQTTTAPNGSVSGCTQ